MAAAGRRAEAARGHPAPAQCVLAGGSRRVHRGVHGPTRCQHRDRCPADAAADVPLQRRRGDLGGPELPLGPGGHGGGRRTVRRHVGAQAPLRLRLRDLHRRLGAVRPGPEPGHADRVPGAPSGGSRAPAGQQRGHHRAGRAQGRHSERPSGSKVRPRPSDWPSARRSGGSWWQRAGGGSSSSSMCPSGCSAWSPGCCWFPGAAISRPGCVSTGAGLARVLPCRGGRVLRDLVR